MKTQFRLPLLALFALTALVSSCKKDSESEPAPKAQTKTELLSGKNWVLTAQTVDPGLVDDDGKVVTDLFPYIDDCNKDDLMRFETAGSCTLNEGASRCVPTDPQQYSGTWSFDSNETVLKTTMQGLGSSSYNIIELSDKTLKVSGVRSLEGDTYRFTYTYAKK
ncbi:DUF5004 domain-containing protein [Hymenobacter sp. BT635]|uniref:DUF5004 domain-containing protein n=1 Tax=Hymenobacter nitidus TaxID=2880929 RepID=A0ABS8AE84_9BACT|nr:DUF5004 domain-containing protein [Hymenobacter nitidus]MCB2378692.1 DUF5004 domain-containing protein [Hymenobacter nitidus]